MDNSLVTHLSGYVNAIFADVRYAYSRDSDWQRDKTRLIHELEAHGPRILTIVLPALAKHFYKCLDQGSYSQSKLHLGGCVSRRVQVPAFLRDLYLQVFDSEGKLRGEPSVVAISTIVTITRTLSKAKLECNEKALRDEARNFKAIEDTLRTPSLNWLGDDLYHDHDQPMVSFGDLSRDKGPGQTELFTEFAGSDWELAPLSARVLSAVADRISSAFGNFHDERDRELPKHGPGRVSNQPVGVSKYHFSQWPTKLDAIFPYDLYARTDFGYGEDRQRDRVQPTIVEMPSKLIAVPKTMAGPRLIASEPNQQQWIQGLVANQVIERMKGTALKNCISFDNQSHNGALALSASSSGSHATVDLKSASDRLSCWSVERFFRANRTLLERIHASRTRMVLNRVHPSWNQLVLKKCFTQGNALTFPVQSICYGMIAISAVILANGGKVTKNTIEDASKRVRIFGDDIIVPTESLDCLVKILQACQLEVNQAKTFSKGKFRESCGVDAYDGVDVTPVYVKTVSTNPRHEQAESAIDSCNNLFLAGLWHTAEWLKATVRYKIPVVSARGNAFGWKSFVGSDLSGFKIRWNSDLQRDEVKAYRLSDTSDRLDQPGAYKLFEYLLEKQRSSFHHLDFLNPDSKSDRLIVGRKASVMKQGWVPVTSITGTATRV